MSRLLRSFLDVRQKINAVVTSTIEHPEMHTVTWKSHSMENHFTATGNPLIRHVCTADPAVLLHEDTLFLYTGHDESPAGVHDYIMKDWLCFSTRDMVSWTAYPSPLKALDFAWVKGSAFASKVLSRDGRFFWYVAVEHKSIPGMAIGVAVADDPRGPFTDAIGSALITGDMIPANDNPKANLDPYVVVDDDGQAYLFWGNKTCYYAPLKRSMTELDRPIKEVALPGFAEGVHVHRRGDWYYISYGYGFPEKVAYAMSRSIHGPWEFKGILNEIAGNCETNRPAIAEFKSRSYFFYHNGALPEGGSHRRSVCADYLYYGPDGTMERVMMTSEGVWPIDG